jgi:hypothetical protein
MNAYEIRLEVLRIAKAVVQENAVEWVTTDNGVPCAKQKPYQVGEVLQTAKTMYGFVEGEPDALQLGAAARRAKIVA